MLTRSQVEALLTSDLDAVEDHRNLGGGPALVIRFCPPKERGCCGRIVLNLSDEGIRVDSTCTATADFMGVADAYARAATLVRTLAKLGIELV